jgi:TrmH family RNA methyltransferase
MITSYRNPLVKRIKRLGHKKYRQEESAFVVEGLRAVFSAVEARAPIDTIFYSSALLTSVVAEKMLDEQRAHGANCVELSAAVFRSVSERENPMGLGAIVREVWTELADLEVRPDDVLVALVDVSDPGNLGTVIRTMDASGASGLILVGQTVDPFHPTAVRASTGTLFGVDVSRAPDLDTLWRWSAERGLHIVATSARAKHSYLKADYQLPTLLLFGSEREGLSDEVAEKSVRIPMHGSASSLNLAVAAALLLYELRRPRSAG